MNTINRLRNVKQDDSQNTPRILTLDIETRPSEAYVWALWNQNITLNKLMRHGHVICFVAKWYGEKEPIFHSDHHDGHEQMIRRAWQLLDEADIVVTYNGVQFDIPHLQREFALAGMAPPRPWRNIDLLKTVRKEFNFISNKLENVVAELGVGKKMDNGGFDLWRDCINNDPKAWEKMRRYNERDVKITESLYNRLRPWIKNHPHMGLWQEMTSEVCPFCGSPMRLTNPSGVVRTAAQVYWGFTCTGCGGQIRSTMKAHPPLSTRVAQ